MNRKNTHIFPKGSALKMTRMIFTTIFFTAHLMLLTLTAHGEILKEAEDLAFSGNHAEAEAAYDRFLEVNPDHLKARIGRAYVRSWRGHQKSAQKEFISILKAEPRNSDALVGLAYSYAWSGDYDRAEKRFQEALGVDPLRLDAKKGSAFNALWGGKTEAAVKGFQSIIRENPEESEAVVGLGQAFLAAKNPVEAKKAFQKALRISPGSVDARQGLKAVRNLPPKVDLSLWLGHTSHGGDTGLRALEVMGLLKRGLRVWARYDNALTLDNPALVRDGKEIPSYYIGTLVDWGQNYTTRLEIGTRELRNNVDQDLYQGEHVVYLPEGYSVKFGGFLGPKENNGTDWNLYTGIGIPLRPRLALSPTLYYTKTGGIDETEWRILLPVEYRFREGWRAGVYPLLGDVQSVVPSASGTVWGLATVISMPLRRDHEGHLLIRHEAPAGTRSFTIIALGFTFKLGRD